MSYDETIDEYTEIQWAEEMKADKIIFWARAIGTTFPCPSCRKIGFYAPIQYPTVVKTPEEIIRKYRACKFCGFWQDVKGYPGTRREGKSFHCVPLRCTNPKCKTFNYTAEENNLNKPCENCGTKCEESE